MAAAPPRDAVEQVLDRLQTSVVTLEEAARAARAALGAYLGGHTKDEIAAGLAAENNGSPFALAIRAVRDIDAALGPRSPNG